MFRSVALVGLTLVVVAACGSSPTGGVQATSAQATPTLNKNFEVSTPNGQVSLDLTGQLPPSWPTGFPVPKGALPAGSGSLIGSSGSVMVGVYTTVAPAQDTFNFYKSNTELTTSNEKSVGAGSSYVGSLKMSAPYQGSVTVVSRTTTYIVVVLTQAGVTPST